MMSRKTRIALLVVASLAVIAVVVAISVWVGQSIGRSEAVKASSETSSKVEKKSSDSETVVAGKGVNQAAACFDSRFNMPSGVDRKDDPTDYIKWFYSGLSIAPDTLSHSAQQYLDLTIKQTILPGDVWKQVGFEKEWPGVFVTEGLMQRWGITDLAGFRDMQKNGGQRCLNVLAVTPQGEQFVNERWAEDDVAKEINREVKVTGAKVYRVEYNKLVVRAGKDAEETHAVDAVVVVRDPKTGQWLIAGMWRYA